MASSPTRGAFGWSIPSDEQFRFHIAQTRELGEASVAEEAAAALDATDEDVGIGGAGLAAAAIELGLVDELRMFRNPIVGGGGTPYLPPVTEDLRLDLIETRTFGSRVIYERYRRVRGVL